MASIQRDIISKLKNADTLRYSELKPDPEIPNDLYNYHLKKLIANGLITKSDSGYTLSPQGQRHVADVHHTSDQDDRLFKFNALLIVTREINGVTHVLNQLRTSQPSYGIIGIPGGTILKSEPLLDGASRKLQQETGLIGTFEYIGMERRIMYKNNVLFSDVLFPLCISTDATGTPQTTEFGENMWATIDQAILNDSRQHDSIHSIAKVLNALKDNRLDSLKGFYYEQIAK